jgi:plasmid stabilization system protein ParE
MNKPYGSRYLKTVEQDLYETFEYIQKDNPYAALSTLEKFDKSIPQLSLNPLSLNPYPGLIPKR